MSVSLLAILIGMMGSATADSVDGIAIGKRVVSAIKSETDFQPTDFIKPLREGDKDALRRFGKCKLERIMYRTASYPKVVSSNVTDPNQVRVLFKCKGVSWHTTPSLTLHLQDGKIASVETHHADLMRVD